MLGESTWRSSLVIIVCASALLAGASSSSADDAYVVPDVVINEIMWAKSEYVELYNVTDTDISLDGWVITRQKADSSSKDTEVTFGSGDMISAHSFFVTANSGATTNTINKIDASIGLVDTGALIRLEKKVDDALVTVDSANQYENSAMSWYAGENNSVGTSMERLQPITAGQDKVSWHTSTGNIGGRIGTPGEENTNPVPIPSPTPTVSASPSVSSTPIPAYSNTVRINEFLSNPKGDDTTLEFIELYNDSDEVVDISGWKIDDIADAGSSAFIMPPETAITAHGYILFYSSQTKISLNNDSDHVRLLSPDDIVRDDIAYTSSKEGYSYNYVDDSDFQLSIRPTPGSENSIELPSATPTPTPKTTATPRPTSSPKPTNDPATYQFSSKIVINELYSNPNKSAEINEFIEIKNLDNRSILLAGWTLDDEDGGSKPYRFTSGDSIGTKKILRLDKKTTKLAFNNSDDSARLIDPSGKVVALMSYQKTYPGQSLSRLEDGSYQWTNIITPGKENIISVQEKYTPAPAVRRKAKASAVKGAVFTDNVTSSVALSASPLPDKIITSVSGNTSVPDGIQVKKRFFVFFGLLCASAQFMAGVKRKESIWRGSN